MAISLEQFAKNLIGSGLFSAAELAAFQDKLAPEKRPKDAQGLARELNRAGKLTKHQAAMVYQGKTKDLVFDEYIVLDRIGAGGMGEVFKARHRTMDRTVAVKVLPAKAMRSEQAVERFQREVKAAAKLTHSNIVTAFDAGEADGIYFLVMEYIDGQDLAHVVAKRGPLPIEEAVGYVIQAARGLEYAHRQGVVHRDIKPGNLLLDSEGTVKVLDLGLARLDQPARATDPTAPDALTASGQVMGTYDYMAPEQAQDTHSADHRADIYSLGCTLFRLVTGRKLYVGETPVQILLAHCQEPVPSLCEVREDVSPELDSVSQKMLAKSPEDRQQSMGEVIADLESCIRPPGPEPPTPPPVQGPATESSSSSDSALKAFFRRITAAGTTAAQDPLSPDAETRTYHAEAEAETVMPLAPLTASSAPRKKKTPWAMIGGIAGLLVILVVGIVLLGRTPISEKPRESAGGRDSERPIDFDATPPADEPEAYLTLRWPKVDRTDARLLIDDRPYDLSGPRVQTTPDEIQIAVRLGPHKVWITRRGFEPIEERFEAVAGKEHPIRLQWEADPGLVERAEEQPKPEAPTPKPSEVAESPQLGEPEPDSMEAETPALDPEAEKRLAAETRYTEAMKPVDDLIAAWDFREASAALSKLQFPEPDLTARLAAWRASVARLADLKARIIAKINTANPPLKTTALLIRGAGRDLVKAEEDGLTTRLRTDETQSLPWPDVGPQAIEKLIGLVSTPDNATDHLAAGVLALASKAPTSAEKLFDEARSLGAEVGPYLAPLAATAFAQARQLTDEKKFPEADALLANLEAKYADTAWFASNLAAFEAVRAEARAGIHENEAEKLYAEAAELFKQEQLFDVKPLVEKLKRDYAQSGPVIDAERDPSFAELEQATANLGLFITVRQDGKGDFTSIQTAIDAAPPNSLIEIQDSVLYKEQLSVPGDKMGLTLRGNDTCWPQITSLSSAKNVSDLLSVEASDVTLERLLLLHGSVAGEYPHCLVGRSGGRLRLRRLLIYLKSGRDALVTNRVSCRMEECVVIRRAEFFGPVHATNCLFLGANQVQINQPSVVQFCTIVPNAILLLRGSPTFISDCIFAGIRPLAGSDAPIDSHVIRRCDVFATAPPKGSEGCFTADPQFRDPANLDYRLMPTSPCIGKASDGGDIGCRYTPEMIEMCQKALELRAKGIIQF